MNQNKNTVIWGLIIMAVGIIFLGNSTNIWNIEIFFEGWWTLFIIIPSLTGLFKKQTIYSSILGLTIGILLLIAAQGIITWEMVGKIFIPILLIVIGFSLVFKKSHKKNLGKNKVPEFVAVFSGCSEKITEKLKGANCTAIFGGIELDLRNAKITEDIVINCTTIFGGIDLFVPDNVQIKTSGTPIFGGTENKTNNKPSPNAPTIYINYVSIFAGIDIK